jgi:hypothetical protein
MDSRRLASIEKNASGGPKGPESQNSGDHHEKEILSGDGSVRYADQNRRYFVRRTCMSLAITKSREHGVSSKTPGIG